MVSIAFRDFNGDFAIVDQSAPYDPKVLRYSYFVPVESPIPAFAFRTPEALK